MLLKDTFTLSLPIAMVKKIDKDRGLIPRSVYVTKILERYAPLENESGIATSTNSFPKSAQSTEIRIGDNHG